MDKLIKALTCNLLVLCLLSPAWVAASHLEAPHRLLLAATEELSSGEAARLVQRNTRGKVLRVKDSGDYYQVKVLLPSGVVRSYSVNKITGKIS